MNGSSRDKCHQNTTVIIRKFPILTQLFIDIAASIVAYKVISKNDSFQQFQQRAPKNLQRQIRRIATKINTNSFIHFESYLLATLNAL